MLWSGHIECFRDGCQLLYKEVSRTIGDVEAKNVLFGGIPGVISHEPDVESFVIDDNFDYLLLGCDGIFDQLTNEEVDEAVWLGTKGKLKENCIHKQCGLAVDLVIKASLIRKSMDNVSVVFLAFNRFERAINGGEEKDVEARIRTEVSEKKIKRNVSKPKFNKSVTLLKSENKIEIKQKKLKIKGKSPKKANGEKTPKMFRKTAFLYKAALSENI